MRKGRCILNKYLNDFEIRNDPIHKCDENEEIIERFLLCEQFDDPRNRSREMEPKGMRSRELLGDLEIMR